MGSASWSSRVFHPIVRGMRAINFRAVILATLAVFGIDIVSGFALMAVYGAPAFTPEMTDAELKAAVDQLTQNSGYLRWALLLGTASTVIGGYLAARLAGSVPYFNALAFGVIAMLVSTLSTADLPMWFRAVGLSITIPAALFGGHIAKRQAKV